MYNVYLVFVWAARHNENNLSTTNYDVDKTIYPSNLLRALKRFHPYIGYLQETYVISDTCNTDFKGSRALFRKGIRDTQS